MRTRHEHYILDGKEAKPVDLMTWARWLEVNRDTRIVAKTELDGAKVSTVFIGLDHNFSSTGPAHIFETMVFGGPHDGEMNRYPTWSDAEKGHAEMVARISQPHSTGTNEEKK